MEYGFTPCKPHVTTWQNFSFTGVCARKIHNWNLWILLCFFFISRRVEVDKKNQHPARHLNNYGLQQTIFHVSPTDGVGHKRRGGLNFSDDPLFSSFTVRGGVKLWHPNGHKIPEKHMVMWLLHFPGLFDPFMRERESFSFSKDVLNWLLISDFPASENCFWHYCRGRKIEQRQISRIDSRWMVC